MKGVTTLSALAAVALTLAACNPAPPAAPDTHDADVKAISDLEAQTNQAWAAKDADKIMAFYADDAVLMTPGSDVVHGKDGVRTSLKGDARRSCGFAHLPVLKGRRCQVR